DPAASGTGRQDDEHTLDRVTGVKSPDRLAPKDGSLAGCRLLLWPRGGRAVVKASVVDRAFACLDLGFLSAARWRGRSRRGGGRSTLYKDSPIVRLVPMA